MTDLRAVETANTALYTAVESGDLDLMGAVWLDEPDAGTVVCVHPGWPPLRGRAEIMRSWAAIMAGTPYIQFFLTDVSVHAHGDVAVVTCTENILTGMEDPSDGTSGFVGGGRVAATNVFRRTPAGWRLWVHHASPVLSPTPGEGPFQPSDEEDS